MKQGMRNIVYPVKDIAQATKLYTALLGVEPYTAQPYYVGYRIGEHEIGLDPNGHMAGMTGPIAYYHVADIKTSLQTLLDGGATTVRDVTDVGGGMLIATVKDADDNVIGITQVP